MTKRATVKEVEQALTRCEPCWGRRQAEVRATRIVGNTPMCEPCFNGDEVSGSLKPRQVRMAELKSLVSERVMTFSAEASARLVKPYMLFIDRGFCVACGQEIGTGAHHSICDDCKRTIAVLKSVKSWLRSYRKSGDVRELQNAAGVIRKLELKPEDLQRV